MQRNHIIIFSLSRLFYSIQSHKFNQKNDRFFSLWVSTFSSNKITLAKYFKCVSKIKNNLEKRNSVETSNKWGKSISEIVKGGAMKKEGDLASADVHWWEKPTEETERVRIGNSKKKKETILNISNILERRIRKWINVSPFGFFCL